MLPQYSLDKIKFGTDGATFERAVGLYESGKVTKFKTNIVGFFAVVLGSKPYRVFTDGKHFDQGNMRMLSWAKRYTVQTYDSGGTSRRHER